MANEIGRGREMASARFSRRAFLKSAAVAAAVGPAALAACTRSHGDLAFFDWKRWWARQEQTGVVDFANWPYYIDRRRDGSHPSLERFTRRTAVQVNYYRPIRDNEAFLEQIAPDLEAGRPIGYDVIVITNGPQLSELIHRDWLIPLDHTRLPHFDRWASPIVKGPAWDPGNRYSVAWQSGLTGIAYRPQAVEALGRRPSRIADLFDDRLAGRVGMLTDLMDLGSFGLLATGHNPRTSGEPEWREAAAFLTAQRERGLVLGYYDQGYVGALQRGDVWISQAWSGDIYQAKRLGHDELEFVVPDEGAMFWTDNMVIPRGAEHPVDALALMDFVYRPPVAAAIADWVWYICPVPRAQGIVANNLDDPRVAGSDLVFPTRDLLGPSIPTADGDALYPSSPLRYYPTLGSVAQRSAWSRTFAPIVTG
jgi:spermidine/putrescine transport system substrate-binding protein